MKRIYSVWLLNLASGALVALSAGCCSCAFNHNWNKTVSSAAPEQGIQGPWDGSWQSEVNGHHGRLRCLMTKESDQDYRARFNARFWKIFSYSYTVPLQVRSTNGVYQFDGRANLGKLAGGIYSYEGHATPTNFFSTFTSRDDHGTFQMTRPK